MAEGLGIAKSNEKYAEKILNCLTAQKITLHKGAELAKPTSSCDWNSEGTFICSKRGGSILTLTEMF